MVPLLLVVGCWCWRRAPAAPAAPEALWHNGVIVEVRNCDIPSTEEIQLRCAAMICAQRVTAQLTNPQQTSVKLTRYHRDTRSGLIKIAGTLDQYLASPTLPIGFTCVTTDPQQARPELQYAALPRPQP